MKTKLPLGCVVYTETNNGIKAELLYRKNDKTEHGKGLGLRLTELNKKRKFVGEYEITYTDAHGNKSPTLHLIISFESGHYQLVWSKDKKITDIGIGIDCDNKLFASYTEVI